MVMMYAPHVLLRKERAVTTRDELGRVIRPSATAWVEVGRCRCDDNGEQEIANDNGELFRPTYHIVAEKGVDVRSGDTVRVLNTDGSERGGGIVNRVTVTNYLDYASIYV